MKKFYFYIVLFVSTITMFSCDKISGSGGSDTPTVITDPLLIGTWNVVKYEALDKSFAVIKTETGSGTINATYYKFVFDENGRMQCWYNLAAGQCISTSYSYLSLYGDLLFGDTGQASVTTLNETSLVFESTSFAPNDWYEDTNILTFRVTCTKQAAQN